MRVLLKTTSGTEFETDNITQLSFSRSVDAACDSLCVYFKAETAFDEIVGVRLYHNDSLIFNGLCDCQKTIEDENGFGLYIYARSSACVLVDNQAEPYTYSAPTAKQLCYTYARPFGFECNIPELYSNEAYKVSGGTSCYGAINRFVYLCTGHSIAASPENELYILKSDDSIKSLNAYDVLSVKSTINRSEPISVINYKDTLGSRGYNHHCVSDTALGMEISRQRYVNLNSLAPWQRDYTIMQKLRKSFDSYKLLELELGGYVGDDIMQRFSYSSRSGEFVDYVLIEKRYICDERGSRTRLLLRKTIDVKENTYVD